MSSERKFMMILINTEMLILIIRFKCHLASAAVAGVTATLVASPVDVIKTRLVNPLHL